MSLAPLLRYTARHPRVARRQRGNQETFMSRLLPLLLVATLLMSGAPRAAGHPNFTGEWTVNTTQSNWGQMPAPTRFNQKITHNDPDLKVVTEQSGAFGDFTSDFSFTTDGKECPNQMNDFKMKSTVKWDGDTLVFDSQMDFQGTAITGTERWTMSSDGKTITRQQHFSGPMGEGDATVVLDKVN
jgi:hypothetical protein